jgi:hypothetical protein
VHEVVVVEEVVVADVVEVVLVVAVVDVKFWYMINQNRQCPSARLK